MYLCPALSMWNYTTEKQGWMVSEIPHNVRYVEVLRHVWCQKTRPLRTAISVLHMLSVSSHGAASGTSLNGKTTFFSSHNKRGAEEEGRKGNLVPVKGLHKKRNCWYQDFQPHASSFRCSRVPPCHPLPHFLRRFDSPLSKCSHCEEFCWLGNKPHLQLPKATTKEAASAHQE